MTRRTVTREELIGKSLAVIVTLIFMAVLFVGWIMNLASLCKADFKAPYKNEIIRGFGVFVPFVGGVAGYIPIKDGEPDNQKCHLKNGRILNELH